MPETSPWLSPPDHGIERPPDRVWIAFVVVGFAVLGAAALKFFTYPLYASPWTLFGLLVLPAWLMAAALAVAAMMLVPRGRSRPAAAVTLIAVLGLMSAVVADLELGYPYAYFHLHRSEFARAADFAESIPVDHDGLGSAWLPADQRDLAGGHIDVGPSPNGSRTAVLWMEITSGSGYGYAYAPFATRSRDAVLTSPVSLVAKMALGDGWWWVSNM